MSPASTAPRFPVPPELIVKIFRLVPHKLAFRFGVILAKIYDFPDVRDAAIPHLRNASMDAASKKGHLKEGADRIIGVVESL